MAERPAALSRFARFTLNWLPVVLYVSLMLTLSAQPNLRTPLEFKLADKLSHMLEYFGLGLLLASALRAGRLAPPMRTATMAVIVGGIVGVADEILQKFVPGRHSDVWDVLADTTGVLLAQVVAALAARK